MLNLINNLNFKPKPDPKQKHLDITKITNMAGENILDYQYD